MSGVNFDRAAAFYDATRALPYGVAEEVRDALLRHLRADPDTRFLEVVIGTGCIGVPFMAAGYAYCGVDLSAAMLAVLRAKLASLSEGRARAGLALADATSLPFRPAAFDVVLMIRLPSPDPPRGATCAALRQSLIRPQQERLGDRQAERLGGPEG